MLDPALPHIPDQDIPTHGIGCCYHQLRQAIILVDRSKAQQRPDHLLGDRMLQHGAHVAHAGARVYRRAAVRPVASGERPGPQTRRSQMPHWQSENWAAIATARDQRGDRLGLAAAEPGAAQKRLALRSGSRQLIGYRGHPETCTQSIAPSAMAPARRLR